MNPEIVDLLVMLSQLLNLLVLIVKCKHVILLLVYAAMQQLYRKKVGRCTHAPRGCTEEMHQIYRGRYVVIIQRCQRLTAIGVYPWFLNGTFHAA